MYINSKFKASKIVYGNFTKILAKISTNNVFNKQKTQKFRYENIYSDCDTHLVVSFSKKLWRDRKQNKQNSLA